MDSRNGRAAMTAKYGDVATVIAAVCLVVQYRTLYKCTLFALHADC